MEVKKKELINAVRKLLEKAGITRLEYFEDRIERKHESPEFHHYDGCSYYCMKLFDGKGVYLEYSAKRGESYYSNVQTIKEFSSTEEALKFLYLNEINTQFYSRYICKFEKEHKELISLDSQKQYPTTTIKSIIKAFEIIEIPELLYGLGKDVKPESVCYIEEEERYRIRYYNSGMRLADERIYEKKSMRNIALLVFYTSVFRLYLWKQYVNEIKEQGEDIFQIQEEDYGPYVIL